MLTSFSVENYRAFARRQEIEIRPLTLFFGWNSGGKSALLRFLPLLAESIRASGPPIWLAGEVGRGATWPELVCKSTERGNLGFSISWQSQLSLFAKWEIGGDLEGRWQEAKTLSINLQGVERSLTSQEIETFSWDGPAPRGANAEIVALNECLNDLALSVQWVSGVRIRPPRIATYGGGVRTTLSPDGSDAIDHLIAAQLRSSADPLLEMTQKFFACLGEQLILDNPMEGAWRVQLHPHASPNVRVNLCDTGEGYSQVLPVLVALARSRLDGPKLLCLEQPELHLHTRAQAEFAKILAETATAPTQPQILVETHSEVLLTSIQLAIAKGEISHEKVRVYWVESHLNGTSDVIPVDFDAQGRPTSTALIGAFTEAIQLGQELILKQMPRLPS